MDYQLLRFYHSFMKEGATVLIPIVPFSSVSAYLIPSIYKGSPANIHAGGLRYHGAGVIVSQLLKDNLMEAVDIQQFVCLHNSSDELVLSSYYE